LNKPEPTTSLKKPEGFGVKNLAAVDSINCKKKIREFLI